MGGTGNNQSLHSSAAPIYRPPLDTDLSSRWNQSIFITPQSFLLLARHERLCLGRDEIPREQKPFIENKILQKYLLFTLAKLKQIKPHHYNLYLVLEVIYNCLFYILLNFISVWLSC